MARDARLSSLRGLARLLPGAALTLSLAAFGHCDGGGGHTLAGPGAFGNIALLGKLVLTDTPGTIADVAVSPDGQWAFLAKWSNGCFGRSESGGIAQRDGGAYVVDISNLGAPVRTGFIPAHQDTTPGEGMQVVALKTKFFSGNVLVMNNEPCGKNGKGGISLWDVTNPRKPMPLSSHFGDRAPRERDTHATHSAFAWQAADGRAYAVMADNVELSTRDVDVLDITNPSRPRLIAEYDLQTLFPQIRQAEPSNLRQIFLHDMVVKRIDGREIMLLSYWDGGFVKLDVTDPLKPVYLADSDYAALDPQLLERSGVSLRPEGNAHQAEFTRDNAYVIGTDEDFDPYGIHGRNLTEAAPIDAASGDRTRQLAPNASVSGQSVFVGRACLGDAAVPTGNGTQIAVVERGLCTFSEKVGNVLGAGGYAAVLIFNRTAPDACEGSLTMAVDGDIPTFGVAPRSQGFAIFGAPYDLAACLAGNGTQQAPIPIGTTGDLVQFASLFDGWGYVHLYRNGDGMLVELDTYAISEAHDPAFATGFGNLTVHEVATDPTDASRAYLAYYAGGLRAMQIVGGKLVETGGYLDRAGNDFWGVEVFVRNGEPIILGSDRNTGLWIFRRTGP